MKGRPSPFILGLALVAACVPSARAPEAAVAGTLSPGAETQDQGAPAAFRVAFAGPRGEVEGGAQLSIVFSRPVRALEPAGSETPPPFRIEPALGGEWRAIGTSAWAFSCALGQLPAASHFTVTVPKGFAAQDGSRLDSDYVFDFSTPRPALAQTSPGSGQSGLGPDTVFELTLNQRVDKAELEKKLSLRVVGAKSRKLAFTLRVPDPQFPKRLELVPNAKLPASSTLELALAEGTQGEGPLTTNHEQKLSFETYTHLFVSDLECSRPDPKARCQPRGSVWLSLSNPVKMRDLKRAVSIEPALPITWESWRDDEDETSYLDLIAPFSPGQSYTIHVAATVRDIYGQQLSQAFSRRVDIDDFEPLVQIGAEGQYFEPAARTSVPVGSVNVDSYQLWALPLDAKSLAAYHAAVASEDREGAIERLLRQTKPRLIRPTAAKNTPAEQLLDTRQVLEKQGGRGPLLVAARWAGRDQSERVERLLQVTDLAISAKLSRAGNSVVWVTELSTGKPVEGAEVSVVGPGIVGGTSVKSDAHGLVVLAPGALGSEPRKNGEQTLVMVKKGSDWSYRKVGDWFGSWRLGVGSEPFGEPATLGLLFTERGLYRPGDKLQLKGILRKERDGGNEVLAGRKYQVQVRAPSWEILQTHPITTNAFGAFSLELALPRSADLGSYRVEVQAAGDEALASTYFELAEYRPTEIEAHASTDHPSYERDQRAVFAVQGDYLYGAPMAKAQVTYRITRSETYFSLPGAEDWVTSASLYDEVYPERAPTSFLMDSGAAELDGKGRFERPTALSLPGQRGTELVSFDAELADVSRQTVASSSSALVHPASHYVGLERLDPFFVDVTKPFTPRAIVATPEGVRLGGKKVEFTLYRRRWSLVRETAGGSSHSEMRVQDERVASCQATSSIQAPSGCPLAPRDAGYYVILATARDAKGHEARAAIDGYALGEGQSFWPDDDAHQLELVANKTQYRPGETARILVKSPFARAEALVTVEADGVRQERQVTLSGATPVLEVPITDTLRPNAYVGVHLVRPRQGPMPAPGKADLGAPTFRTGYVTLNVDPELRRLAVALTPNKTAFAPGEELDLDITVRGAAGRGEVSEVTVYAVDEGVLSLVGYRTPDPLPVFTAARPLRTALLEAREDLGRVQPNLSELLGIGPNKGAEGGGGGDEAGARRDFRQSAYFNPAVLTGADGRAHVRFRLPEGLTTYRLMAVATTQSDRYGYAEKRVTTSKQLMARPALPRFLRAGDSFDAGVIVSGKDFGPAPVTVRLTASGLGGSQITASREISLEQNGQTEVRFPVNAERVGAGHFRFDVSANVNGKAVTDAVVVDRNVTSPARLEAVALYGQTEGAVSEKLGDLSGIRRDVGSLALRAASSALVGLDGGFEQLFDYPYGCTEQLSSRLLPLLPLRELALAYGVPLPENSRSVVEKAVADILGRQRGDGGFGMWPESSESSPWVSPYALWTLFEAKERGYAVPARALDQGREYLRRSLADEASRPGLAARAFAVDVLELLGEPDAGYENALFERRAELPAFAQALLLHALSVTRAQGPEAETLERELENRLQVSANTANFVENTGSDYAALFDSSTRTTALVLRGLLAKNPRHELGARLARGLLGARRNGSWRSTQETAFALLALDAYRKAQEAKTPDFRARFWQGDDTLLDARLEGHSTQSLDVTLPMARLGSAPLVFEKVGGGTLFYEARLRYAPTRLPGAPLDRGFWIQKGFREATPDELAAPDALAPSSSQPKAVRAGALLIVDLVVVSPEPRNFVALDDPLPAGFEAIDSNLVTSAAWTQVGGSAVSATDDRLAHGLAFQESSFRRELRDDRVLFFVDHLPAGMFHYRYLARATTFGHFIVPPTRAEEMYSPEVFGRTASSTVTVQ